MHYKNLWFGGDYKDNEFSLLSYNNRKQCKIHMDKYLKTQQKTAFTKYFNLEEKKKREGKTRHFGCIYDN